MSSNVQHSHQTRWERRKVLLLTTLFGAIPLSIGHKIRRLVYRPVVGQMGNEVYLGTGLQLMGAKGIYFEDKSVVEMNVQLDCEIANSRIILRSRSVLGRGVCLAPLGGCIEIGEMACIGYYFCAAGPGDIRIGKNCMIASHTSMYANNHVFSDPDSPIAAQGLTCKGIVIEDDCWLGTGVRVLDGVTIGRGSVIGAGAVVTKSIPPLSVAVGVPASVIAKRGEAQSKLVSASTP